MDTRVADTPRGPEAFSGVSVGDFGGEETGEGARDAFAERSNHGLDQSARFQVRFARFAWGVLSYFVGVIVFGAFVRATESGDGCGAHWPLCDGQVIPLGADTALRIEFTHRLSSALAGILAFALLIGAFRAFAPGGVVRKTACAVMAFTIVEALIGAVLVKKGWVAQDDSIGRAIAMGAHLVNTFVLLFFLVATAYFASRRDLPRLKGQGALSWGLAMALAGMLLLGVSGAVTALGDTLFPAKSLAEGLRHDLSPTAHFLIRLRLFHPLIATSVGVLLLLVATVAARLRPDPDVRRFAKLTAALVFTEMAAGFVNLILLAPIWMQLVHLFLADALWISLVLLCLAVVRRGVSYADLGIAREAALAQSKGAARRAASFRAYIALTKPRVVSLLLFTTIAAMFMAKGGWPGIGLLLAVSLGGYMAAGAANAINMVMDRDIDAEMARTSRRPTVTHEISSVRALAFAVALAIGSFTILWSAANLLAAILALAGLAFYVVVYTAMLKRRTWHNIVIGGAAGAVPPLVGWASVTSELDALAWALFALIFVWTPVHFWALAILIKDDYAKAGVPMLPVVRGERATVLQIALYAVLTALVSLFPLLLPNVGIGYLATAVLLNMALLAYSAQLYFNPERPQALRLFKYSMVYLAVMFLALAIDRSVLS